jgi:hypothetical protein
MQASEAKVHQQLNDSNVVLKLLYEPVAVSVELQILRTSDRAQAGQPQRTIAAFAAAR